MTNIMFLVCGGKTGKRQRHPTCTVFAYFNEFSHKLKDDSVNCGSKKSCGLSETFQLYASK